MLVLAACEQTRPGIPLGEGMRLAAVDFSALPGWREDGVEEAMPALERSCGRLLRLSADATLAPSRLNHRAGDWQPACTKLLAGGGGQESELRTWFESSFSVYRISGDSGSDGLITGYFETEVRGAKARGGPYQTAVYRRPADLLTADLGSFSPDFAHQKLIGRAQNGKFVPYYTRAEIDAGKLADRGLELLWLDDPIDAFFLHVQGSGRVQLPDGSIERIGFAGSNGRPYSSIGKVLIQSGEIPSDRVSMQSIRDWLRAHPAKATAIMQKNARFIFFDKIAGAGPIGSEGVALTAGRSLAVDPAYLPFGAPLWLDTTWPASTKPLRRLVVAQDSGAAIRGPVRGDLFWGHGEDALALAGPMKQQGSLYLLLPKRLASRLSSRR